MNNTYTYTLPEDIKATTLTPRTVEEFRLREDYFAGFITDAERSTDEEIRAKIDKDKPEYSFIDNVGIKVNIRRWIKSTIKKFNISAINARKIIEIDMALIEVYNTDEIKNKIIVVDGREVIPAGTEIVTDVDIRQLFRTAAKIAKRCIDDDARNHHARIDEAVNALGIE